MGTLDHGVFRRVRMGALLASLVLAAALPAAAFAANTATFSSKSPASGATLSAPSRPTIWVTVYDRYGLHGAGAYSMTLDGHAVKPTATYLVSGPWNAAHPDYRRVRLAYRLTGDLPLGPHRITVKTHDLRHRNSTYSWSFTVTNPVAFSAPVPAGGSSDDEPRPAISVSVSALNGALGSSGLEMTIDGHSVTPLVSYSTRYTQFKIAAPAMTSDLGVGVHTIAVTVTDLKGKTGSYSWSITVLAPPIVPMPNSVAMTDCAGCHAGFPSAHPMTDCVACHNGSAPRRIDGTPMRSYTAGDTSAHTPGCAANPVCHRGGGTFPHVLDGNCARCHTGTFPGIGPIHSTSLEPYHRSASAFCVRSGCHVASLTTEHYRRTIGGVPDAPRLSCDTCHKSTDPRVRTAIASRSTACEGCHDFTAHTPLHSVTRNDTCAAPKCHGSADSNLITIHAGCASCHGDTASSAAKSAILAGVASCSGCHGFTSHTAQHAVTRDDTCAVASCHGSVATDLTAVHGSCAECHGKDAPAATKAGIISGDRSCANCHGFLDHGAAHVVKRTDSCAAAPCHGSAKTSLMTIHSGCIVCHAATASAATKSAIATHKRGCANCHGFLDHSGLHDVVRNDSCAACHAPTDTSLITIHKKACDTCHDSLASNVRNAISAGIVSCAQCHANHDLVAAHAATPASQTIVINGVGYGTHACADCHSSLDLRTLHAGNCALCHAAGVKAVLGGTWTRSCVQGGCHSPSSTKPMHGAADTSHTITTWPAKFGGCTTGSCHGGGADLAKVHAAKLGCATCHGGAKVPTLDCGAVACHAGLDHAAKHALPSPRVDGCTGSACHDGTNLGAIQFKGATSAKHAACATCHSSSDPNVSGAIASHDLRCATCHPTVDHAAKHGLPSPRVDGCTGSACHNGTNLTAIRFKGAVSAKHGACATCHASKDTIVIGAIASHDLRCATCHPTIDHAAKHALPSPRVDGCTGSACHDGTNLGAIRFKGSVSAKHAACATCHSSSDPNVIGAIAEQDLRCDTCHPTTDHAAKHALPSTRVDGCTGSQCHDGTNLTAIRFKGAVSAKHAWCATCHSSSDPNVIGAIAEQDLRCDTCHPTTDHAAKHALPATRADGCTGSACHDGTNLGAIRFKGAVSAKHASCATCHSSSDPNVIGAIAEQDLRCDTCHPTTDHTAKHALPATRADGCTGSACHDGTNLIAINSTTGVVSAKHGACVTCHASKDSRVTGAIAANDLRCATCHPSAHSSSHAWCSDCHSAIYGLSYRHYPAAQPDRACSSCHGTPFQTLDGAIWAQTSDDHISSTCANRGCHDDWGIGSPNDPGATGDLHTVPASSAACLGSGCHAGNLTLIHAKGCATCHEPDPAGTIAPATIRSALANHDTSCAACHGPGSPADHGSHPATVSAGTITILGTRYADQSCSSCHGTMDLQLVHGEKGNRESCTKCHPTPASTASDGFSCLQDACHKAGTPRAMHVSVDAEHTLGAAPSCIARDCHTGGVGGTNVIAIHTAQGCVTCHSGSKALTTNCSAPDCHDPAAAHPYPDAHPKMADSHALGLSPTCVKSGCHTGDVVAIHGRTRCPACHGNPDHALSKDCVTCHPDTSLTAHVNVHLDCNVCHTKAGGWHPRKYGTPAPAIISAATACSACHTSLIGSPTSALVGRYPHPAPWYMTSYTCSWNCHGNQDSPQWQSHLNGPYDKIPPTTTATRPGSSGGSATIELTVTDTGEYSPLGSGVAHTYYKIDGGGWAQGTTVVIPAPGTGAVDHHVYFYSDDACGNTEAQHDITVSVTAE